MTRLPRTLRRGPSSRPTTRTRLSVLPLEDRVTPSAPIPVGPEFQVNTYTAGWQLQPATAMDAAGNFVIAWNGKDHVGDSQFIYAQRYNADGVPQGIEFQVNSTTAGGQSWPSVAMTANGAFVVTWEGTPHTVFAQRFSSSGMPQGGELEVSTNASTEVANSQVAINSPGNFVITWASDGQILARQYDAAGNPQGGEFRVDSGGNGHCPDIAVTPDSSFVITWNDWAGYVTRARRFDANGQPLGPTFQLGGNHNTDFPAVATDEHGNFAIVWGDNVFAKGVDVFCRRFDSMGIPIGDAFRVNPVTYASRGEPAIAMSREGDFVVTWIFGEQPTLDEYAQAYTPLGVPVGPAFRVNTYTMDRQSGRAIAIGLTGNFVIAWESWAYSPNQSQDGDASGVFAQRYRPGVPQVQATQVNDGAAQRSRVTNLTVKFDTKVTFAGQVAEAFTLLRDGGKPVSFTATANVVNGLTVVTLSNFTGGSTQFGSLADGRYTLTAIATQITDNRGQFLDGDGDGQPGGNYVFGEAQGLFRFFGDINGDRHVDIADFGLFSSTFNLHAGQTGFIAAFDFNGDGTIDIADFGQFSVRLFTPLP